MQRILVLVAIGVMLMGCQPSSAPPAVRTADPGDFADTSSVHIDHAEGLVVDLWAPRSLLASPVALSFDGQGRAYVTETQRRQSSDLDIRRYRHWMVDDLGLTTLAETEAFHRQQMAVSDSSRGIADHNGDGRFDWRDLTVQSERIHRVWDRDGDGRADASNVFADGFSTLLTGVAAGVLHHDGAVYLTVAPDLWRLRDADGDGWAEQRASLSHGYGVHIGFAGHDMSGLAVGPDGKIYWSIGDLGADVTGPDGSRWSFPHEGLVLRANPDGSDFEVYAHGLRNTQEIAFDAFGNLISVDNDGDFPGEHERIVHIIEGSDTGWRTYWQYGKYEQEGEGYNVWMDEGLHRLPFVGRPAYALPPVALAGDGPAGLAYHPGVALDSTWAEHFFVSYFTGSASRAEVQAFTLSPKGASFTLGSSRPVVGGILATGMAFGPDGALYLADWLEGWSTKAEGRIWKVDVLPGRRDTLRAATAALLAEGLVRCPATDLVEYLGHADQRVRLATQFELVKRGADRLLLAAAEEDARLLARLHGIWGVGQGARQDPERAGPIMALLVDPNDEVRAQAARVLGEAVYLQAQDHLIAALRDPSPRVRFFAAEALGKMAVRGAFEPLVSLIDASDTDDHHLRHAATLALARIDDVDGLVRNANHPNPTVRLAMVVALRRVRAAEVAVFLGDKDPLVVTEAARAIHDDASISEALPALAEALLTSPVQAEAFVRRAINASLRLCDGEAAERLAGYAVRTDVPGTMRAEALWALGYWDAPPVLDRVEGRYRPPGGCVTEAGRAALSPYLEGLLAATDAGLQAAAARAAGRLGHDGVIPQMEALVQDPATEARVSRAIVHALQRLDAAAFTRTLRRALSAPAPALRAEAWALLSEADLPPSVRVDLLAEGLAGGTLQEQQNALAALGQVKHPAAAALLIRWLRGLSEGTVPEALHLDVLLAAADHPDPAVAEVHQAYVDAYAPDDPLAGYREVMAGGSAERGRRVVYQHTAAQCMRCHTIEGQGGSVGPPLDGIGSALSREGLLEALIRPATRIAPGYGPANQASAMPSMVGTLTHTELRDVIAFLVLLQADEDG